MREDVRRRRTAVKPPTLLTPEYARALLGTRGSRVNGKSIKMAARMVKFQYTSKNENWGVHARPQFSKSAISEAACIV